MIAFSFACAAAVLMAFVLAAVRGHLRRRDDALLARIEAANRRTSRLADELSDVRESTQRLYWLDQMRSMAQMRDPGLSSLDFGFSKESVSEHQRPG